jgi:hypothetical protein
MFKKMKDEKDEIQNGKFKNIRYSNLVNKTTHITKILSFSSYLQQRIITQGERERESLQIYANSEVNQRSVATRTPSTFPWQYAYNTDSIYMS